MRVNKPILVIDWDETLAFAGQVGPEAEEHPLQNSDLVGHIRKPEGVLTLDRNGVPKKMHLYIRPHVRKFLRKVSKQYQLILWSFGVKEYISQSLKASKLHSFFQGIIARENLRGILIKDLASIEQDLTRIAIIDDSSDMFGILNPYTAEITPIQEFVPNLSLAVDTGKTLWDPNLFRAYTFKTAGNSSITEVKSCTDI